MVIYFSLPGRMVNGMEPAMVRCRKPDGTWDARYVYCLKHPLTGVIGYVGVTKNPKERYKTHVYQSVSYFEKSTHPKDAWIYEMHKLWLMPQMEILEVITDTRRAETVERNWQWYMRDWGNVVENFEIQCRSAAGWLLPDYRCPYKRTNRGLKARKNRSRPTIIRGTRDISTIADRQSKRPSA